jgi:endonuclease YncB( thermonuclease family)
MRLSLALLLSLIAGPALADPCEAPLPKPGTVFSGPVEYIVDGDGWCVRTPAGLVEIRAADFYAVEIGSPSGRDAKTRASRALMGRTLRCVAGGRSYDRVVAHCTADGRPVSDLLRAAGVQEGGRGR